MRLEEDDNLPEVDENGEPVIKEIVRGLSPPCIRCCRGLPSLSLRLPQDGEEVVQEFLGGGERKKVLSATEAKKLAEQEQMKRILNGAYTVESSSTLGHSKAEAQLARNAIQEVSCASRGHALRLGS